MSLNLCHVSERIRYHPEVSVFKKNGEEGLEFTYELIYISIIGINISHMRKGIVQITFMGLCSIWDI